MENTQVVKEDVNTELQGTLIDKYEDDYHKALKSIETDVKDLIVNGSEMKGLMAFNDNILKIVEVHDALMNFYNIIFNNQEVLKKFNSQRLRQLGYEPFALYKQLKEMHISGASDDILERMTMTNLKKAGFDKSHWYIKARILSEIEYLIETLRILIEPEFIPLVESVTNSEEQNASDRYVPSNVKIAVWRRDNGKCVGCGSQEKLEYDHIIPVSKGGSNTERNIQLLCEKCNRQKSARIE
ncbi:MAG: hypothetical protein A2521_05150 [Deltaproteobacteria bacterium RIFOXYD12_FULL_57_12]|nr:MAG: hypothetical protein A2521_05150 [Deltaproteobacteria bacterium RIFOXYD12_FULL_57_12]